MFKVFAIILSFLLFPLQGQNYVLKESLQKAETGDYMVYETARFYTILYVTSKQDALITLEEISVAVDCINTLQGCKEPFDFVSFVKKGALNASAWMTYHCDLAKGSVLKTFSHTRKSEQAPSPLLATLINLPCTKPTTRKMTKKGTPWNPPLHFQGKAYHEVTEEWTGTWPQDGSPLAGAHLSLFTAKPPLLPLPYWIELQKDQRRVLLRSVASGHSS